MKGDLVVLVADRDIEFALVGILSRPEALGIRSLRGIELVPHPQHDPGVFKNGPELLRPYAREFERALVVLDKAWAGAPARISEVEDQLAQRLRPVWDDRAEVVCIDPEIEVWVWSDSPHVARELGWASMQELRGWLRTRELWTEDRHKPAEPKEAFLRAIHERAIPKSPALFRNLASSVGFGRCSDLAFARLLSILRAWFSPSRDERST